MEFIMDFIASGRQLLRDDRLQLAEEVLQWAGARQQENLSLYHNAVMVHGLMHLHSEMFDKALEITMQARQMFIEDGDEDAVAQTSVTIGSTYRALGEIVLAIRYLLEAIAHFESKGRNDFIYIAACYNLAEIFGDGGRYAESLELYDKILAKKGEPAFTTLLGLAFNGIGHVYLKQQEYDKALENFRQGLAESEAIGNMPNVARLHTSIGQYFLETGDAEKALKEQSTALKIREALHIDAGTITNLLEIAGIHLKNEDLNDALPALTGALSLAERSGHKAKLYQVHEALSQLYEKMGEDEKAFHHYKEYHRIREEVDHEDFEKKLKNQQTVFEAEQTRKENAIIKAQKKEIEQKNAELQETIDELTITKISKRAKAITLFIGVALLIIEDAIMHFLINPYVHESFFFSLLASGAVVLLLKPIEKMIEHYLLRRLVLQRRKRTTPEAALAS